MDILRINNNSLKLTLTAEDMADYSLDYKSIEKNKEQSIDTLRYLVKVAGDRCGFVSDGSKFYVQLYASAKGDCEIYIKRINTENLQASNYKSVCVYSFENMTQMLQACSRLMIAKYNGDSTAYKEYNGIHYFLILEERSPLPEEQGGKLCERNTAYYIFEHCKLICSSAVEMLGKLV